MGEAAKLIFGYPVMIDGFALNSNVVPAQHFALLDEVAKTVNALRSFKNGGMVLLWGETDLSGETAFNDTLGRGGRMRWPGICGSRVCRRR